jgi:hypothetical protein
MTRIVDGRIVTDEEDIRKYGPLGWFISFIRSIVAFVQLFFQSVFNPHAMTNTFRRPGSGGGGGGPKRPTMIHRIKPSENCRAGS